MSTVKCHDWSDAATGQLLTEVTAQSAAKRPVSVYNCSRLGRHANPPSYRLSIGDWFRRR